MAPNRRPGRPYHYDEGQKPRSRNVYISDAAYIWLRQWGTEQGIQGFNGKPTMDSIIRALRERIETR